MAPTNELRIFISSTFRDLQEEREHLVKKIFPEIRSLCRERGIAFTDIDLRWGLTEEQAVLGTVIRTCLEEIDKCRPYFIGIIGDRYGWVPELHELLMDPDLLARYPWIEDVAVDGASVTEMEFIHGVFDAPQVDGEYAFFYHRQGDLSESDDPGRLSALISRTRATGHPYREFISISELGQKVHDDLMEMIDLYWPESEAPSALDLERRAHAAFAASRIRAYIPNPAYLKEFTRWLGEGSKPLTVVGASGLGKSSLVAYLVEYYRKKNPTALVIEHCVGASQSSGTALSVMRHVVEEIRERFAIDEELPSKPEELEKCFSNWLFRADYHATQVGMPLLIVLDAVNQLDESGQRLAWLPKTIPAGVKLLISTTPGEAGERLEERGWELLDVQPLEDQRVRQSIVVRYLGEFHKGIAPEQVRQVVSDAKASSPLYLRVVAEELRLHGEHETVASMIARYAQAEDLLQVFDLVLERLEGDYGKAEVRKVLELIWASRAGLAETELLELTGMSRLDLSRLLFALDYHLSRRNGLLGFFHDYLRRAVEKRYLLEESARERWGELARYFESQPVVLRSTRELLHALLKLGERQRLERVIAEVERFEVMWQGDGRYEVLRFWSSAAKERISAAVSRGLSEWRERKPPEAVWLEEVLEKLGELLRETGCWDDATRLSIERVQIARSTGQRQREVNSLVALCVLEYMRGAYTEAEKYVREAEAIARELGDSKCIALAVGNRGVVHYSRGEYDQALMCYAERESIARELGDRKGIGLAVGNRGDVHRDRGEHEQALACYVEWEAIARELGDHQSIALAIGNRGSTHTDRGEYDRALACITEWERVARELGDRRGIAAAVGNRGIVHSYRGEYDDALACFAESELIARELDNRATIAINVGNRGFLHIDRGEHEQALACFAEAADIHREMGFSYGLSYWLQGTAQVLLERVELGEEMPKYLPQYVPGADVRTWRALSLQMAGEQAGKCVAISDELSKPDTYFGGRVLLANIAVAEGDPESARQTLEQMLEEAIDDEQCAELRYCLWKIARTHVGEPGAEQSERHHVEALRLYESLIEKAPKHKYRQYIDDLTAAVPSNKQDRIDVAE